METEIIKTLIGQGVMGIILVWFMFRNEKKAEEITKALNNNSMVMLHLIETVASCPQNKNGNGSVLKKQQLERLKEDILSS